MFVQLTTPYNYYSLDFRSVTYKEVRLRNNSKYYVYKNKNLPVYNLHSCTLIVTQNKFRVTGRASSVGKIKLVKQAGSVLSKYKLIEFYNILFVIKLGVKGQYVT